MLIAAPTRDLWLPPWWRAPRLPRSPLALMFGHLKKGAGGHLVRKISGGHLAKCACVDCTLGGTPLTHTVTFLGTTTCGCTFVGRSSPPNTTHVTVASGDFDKTYTTQIVRTDAFGRCIWEYTEWPITTFTVSVFDDAGCTVPSSFQPELVVQVKSLSTNLRFPQAFLREQGNTATTVAWLFIGGATGTRCDTSHTVTGSPSCGAFGSNDAMTGGTANFVPNFT